MKGLVLSDLHLFLRRSRAIELMPAIEEAVATADLVVLNGDIFDFLLPFRSRDVDPIRRALAWLEKLAAHNPQCHLVYVLGNHDIYQPFVDALRRFAALIDRLEVHEGHVVIGRKLFIHGDCANRAMTPEQFESYRNGWRHPSRRNRLAARIYAVLDRLGLHTLLHRLAFPANRVTRRLSSHLQRVAPEDLARIDEIYFGHTHRPLTGYSLDGIRFHNTGSAMIGMEFNMLHFEIE